jgi:Proline dehydrogenase.
VFKPTSIGRIEVFEAASTDPTFASLEFEAIKRRYKAIGQTAAALSQPIMIDAEESWMQTSADALALDLMREYNINNVLIYNTFQMYLSDRLQKLKDCARSAEEEGFKIGS